MTLYEKTALRAAEIARSMPSCPFSEAWEMAAHEVIENESTREKHCPKLAFVSLCQLGAVKNVLPKEENEYDGVCMRYMESALEILQSDETLVNSKVSLWKRIPGASNKAASRLDPLVALWKAGLINGR